jgi:hypothetical protein
VTMVSPVCVDGAATWMFPAIVTPVMPGTRTVV